MSPGWGVGQSDIGSIYQIDWGTDVPRGLGR